MGIRLEMWRGGPIADKNGNMTPDFQRWLTKFHMKTGGEAEVLPVHLGGTGAASIVQTIANQTASSSSTGSSGSGSNASTQRKTFSLNSPATNTLGDSADTVCTWDTAFPDATYTVTGDYDDPANGSISISAVTTTGFTITLTNVRNRQTAGQADCIGVHP